MKYRDITLGGKYAGRIVFTDAEKIEFHDMSEEMEDYFRQSKTNPDEMPMQYFNKVSLFASSRLQVGKVEES